MKKYLILAAAAIMAMAACTEVNTDSTPQTAVRFSVVNHLQQTRATSGLTYPTSVPFGSFAWWTQGTWTGIEADQTYVFMNNEQVAYGTGVWAPVTPYYWTKSGYITFASYSPYTADGSDKGYSAVPSYDVEKGFLFTNYTIVDDTNIDLMWANLAANCTENTNANGAEVTDNGNPESGFSGVPTVFNHALCQLNFEFRAIGRKNPNVDRIVVDVTDVDILNIDNKGSFTQNNATRWATAHASNTAAYDFAPASTMSLELIENTAANVAATNNYTSLGRSRILLPQTLLTADMATDQKLTVTYTVKIHYTSAPADENDPKYWATEDLTSTVRLNNGAITEWKDNQNITYRISINPYDTSVITFDPAIVDWTDVFSTDVNLNAND